VPKWDCSLEEERILQRLEMVTSVPGELEDPEPMSRQRQCNLQVWAFAASGDGAGAEKVKDLTSSPSFVSEFYDQAGWGTCDKCGWGPNKDVGAALSLIFHSHPQITPGSRLSNFHPVLPAQHILRRRRSALPVRSRCDVPEMATVDLGKAAALVLAPYWILFPWAI